MRTPNQPGDCFRHPVTDELVQVQPDGSLAPWRSLPSRHTAEAAEAEYRERFGLVFEEDEEEEAVAPASATPPHFTPSAPPPYATLPAAPLPAAPLPEDAPREAPDLRADRLFPMVTDRDAEERALLAAEIPADQRVDGWTLAKRQLFLERLADSCSVLEAAHSVGMTRQTARRLYRRAPAFRAAWDAALQQSVAVLAETAFHRARFGTETEVYHDGQVVGHRRVHHDRLLIYLLRVRDPLNYAPIDEVERWQKQRGLAPAAARTLAPSAPAPQGKLESCSASPTPVPAPQGTLEPCSASPAPYPAPQGTLEPCSASPAPYPAPQGTLEPCSASPAPNPASRGTLKPCSAWGWNGAGRRVTVRPAPGAILGLPSVPKQKDPADRSAGPPLTD